MAADDKRDRPPIPSSFVLGEEPDRGSAEAADAGENLNPHLDLANIEERMQSSVARQMLKMFRENPDLAANVVKGMVRKG